MSQEQQRTGNLVDTTDCLEAVSVIRCWKNLLFVVILLGLLLLQGSFWMVNLKPVNGDDNAAAGPPANLPANPRPAADINRPATLPDKIRQAARQIAADVNAPAKPGAQQPQQSAEPNQPQQGQIKLWFEPKVQYITALVRFLDFVLIPAAALYCLTMLFTLKISLIGRLGGINHIARAFFLSLVFFVLLLPWQLTFAPVFAGATFTPAELLAACRTEKTTLLTVAFYLRFCVYWLLVLLLLLFAQIRSIRWARATLRRLEVI